LDRPVDELTKLSMAWAYSWVAAQAFLPIAITVVPLLVVAKVSPGWAGRLGTIGLSAVPAIVLLDCLTFHWIGERFLSSTLLHICISLLPGLMRFVSPGDVLTVAGAIIGIVFLTMIGVVLSRRLSRRWSVDRAGDIAPITVVGLLSLVCGLVSAPALMHFERTIAEMRDHSVRHPLCAFCVVAHRSVGVRVPSGAESIDARLHGMGLAGAIGERIETFNTATIQRTGNAADRLPDVVIVILESVQHSLMTPDVMPNIHRLSQDGYLLRNHFSGGNASNLGIFSLVNGTESSYFPHSGSFVPMMNRLLGQSGYELAFYGGTDDWDEFGMSTFIKPEYYTEFLVEPVDWLASDQRSIDNAIRFLDHSDETQPDRPPRVAVVYLYSSHLPFRSLPEEEVFQPAATGAFMSPYTETQRQLVFNRYRNSIRSLDRMVKPLLTKGRLIVVAGDHGESFMDDGTIGHGTRLSKVQNMTSAMMYLPGQQPRVIDELTTHADVLPTLMARMGLKVQPADVFEGVDLCAADDKTLSERRFASFHYMWPEMMLIGPWTNSPRRPFGYRAAFSTGKWQVAALNPIEELGLEWTGDEAEMSNLDAELDRWLVARFGVNPTLDKTSRIDLFARYIRHPDADIRLQTVEIARLVPDPDSALIDLLGQAVADESTEVRELAGEVIIELQKRIHQ
ncbi:MAG: sulfatase-like hydrolase/transferase, partial [Planctomycetales bacterium]|nr:sulfatase-like hydrolase/transferase [Planctomycetales bacterium]